jgi:hypothetical protein
MLLTDGGKVEVLLHGEILGAIPPENLDAAIEYLRDISRYETIIEDLAKFYERTEQ